MSGDIHVKLSGDGSGAAEAFEHVGGAAESAGHGIEEISKSIAKATEVAHLMEVGFEKLKEGVEEFIKESIHLFAEEEVAIKQMAHAAGENAAAFREQAEAFSAHLGVSAEMVMHMQQIALQFGTLPSEVEPATQAILDWSAATGNDAAGGLQALVRAVDFGQGKVKSLGIEFEVTHDKTQDLKNAIAALSEKFGGSADVMADTLTGRTHQAGQAFEALEKAVGSAFDRIDRKIGILDKAKLALEGWKLQVQFLTGGGGGEEGANKGVVDPEGGKEGSLYGGISLEEDLGRVAKGALGAGVGSQGEKMLAFQREQADEAHRFAERRTFTEEQDDEDLKLQLHNDAVVLEAVKKNAEDLQRASDEYSKQEEENHKRLEDERTKARTADLEREDKEAKEDEKRLEEKGKAMMREYRAMQDETQKESEAFQKKMEQAGAKAGEALISSLTDAITEAMQGGAVDEVGVALDAFFATSAVVGGAIIDYYAPGAGSLAAAATAGIGKIAHQARANAWADQQKKSPASHHDGGWIEPERYHNGGFPPMGADEVPAILQTGEAVLSRSDVARNGGRAGVDAIRKGGGGVTVNLSAMDTQGVMEAFQDRSGRGLFNAVRTGRGPLNLLLGTN